MSAPLPSNESQRLAALRRYGILDTAPESTYDDFTKLAAGICGTPYAFISLIDEHRQWFKSTFGTEVCQTDRTVAFCAYTLEERQLVEVKDTLEDDRFRSHPYVVGELKVRFYAGAPLITPQGFNLGTLCVVDVVPRSLTAQQRESLVTFSRLIVNQLELKLAHQRAWKLSEHLDQLVEERTRDLSEAEQRFRQLAEHSSEGFWFVSVDPSKVIYVNPAIERILGIPATTLYDDPSSWREAVHPDDRPAAYEAMDALNQGRASSMDIEFRVLRPDGSVCWVRDSGTPIHDEHGTIVRVGGIIRDITHRRQRDAHQLRTQRLESLGTLAGGIAHDLNNALSPITIGVAMLRTHCSPSDRDVLDAIEASAKYGAGMIRQLLTFAKGVEGEPVLVQPDHLIRDIRSLMEATFPKNIELRTRLNRGLRPILADPTQLHQVLLNLCVNARDAMPCGGILTLEAENREVTAAMASVYPDAKPGHYLMWLIGDSGVGIAPDVLERIFEPFFTTKAPDKGTGLGLSTVLGIVRSHHGFIRVESQPGLGSKFLVYFPVAEDSVSEPAATAEPLLTGSGERILVVDDDHRTREMLTLFLNTQGFQVVSARDGVEAMTAVNEQPISFDAIITDLHMPRASGIDFIRALRVQDKTTAVLVCSGRLDDEAAHELKSLGFCATLNKPFNRDSFFSKLSPILASNRRERLRKEAERSTLSAKQPA